jgi:hypothetical protein
MNPDERLEMARSVLEQAWTFRQTGQVMATWFIDGHGGLQIIGTPFNEDVPDSKHLMAEVVAELIRQSRPVESVVFVSDAWTRPVNEDWDTPSSQSVNAIEALFVQGWARDGSSFMLMRRDDGRLEILGEELTDRTDTFTFAPVVKALRSDEGR